MKKEKGLNETEKRLLNLIQSNPSVSINQMAEMLFVHRNLVTRYLKRFRENSLVITRGSKKEGYYRKLTNKACILLTK